MKTTVSPQTAQHKVLARTDVLDPSVRKKAAEVTRSQADRLGSRLRAESSADVLKVCPASWKVRI
jgi:hypothetical protein